MTGERAARPGEFCTCGRPAEVVYQTDAYGEVPYCGIPDGGSPAPADMSERDLTELIVNLTAILAEAFRARAGMPMVRPGWAWCGSCGRTPVNRGEGWDTCRECAP